MYICLGMWKEEISIQTPAPTVVPFTRHFGFQSIKNLPRHVYRISKMKIITLLPTLPLCSRRSRNRFRARPLPRRLFLHLSKPIPKCHRLRLHRRPRHGQHPHRPSPRRLARLNKYILHPQLPWLLQRLGNHQLRALAQRARELHRELDVLGYVRNRNGEGGFEYDGEGTEW